MHSKKLQQRRTLEETLKREAEQAHAQALQQQAIDALQLKHAEEKQALQAEMRALKEKQALIAQHQEEQEAQTKQAYKKIHKLSS